MGGCPRQGQEGGLLGTSEYIGFAFMILIALTGRLSFSLSLIIPKNVTPNVQKNVTLQFVYWSSPTFHQSPFQQSLTASALIVWYHSPDDVSGGQRTFNVKV